MKAHELIDRLARLDEAPVVEPEVEPTTVPEEPGIDPGTDPGPGRSPNPYELPPDWEPGGDPYPKAEGEELDAIRRWLEVTQQPVQDWHWDGQKLQMMLDDGNVEDYSRQQLAEIGIFDDEMAFAESQEDDPEALEIETAEEGPCEPCASCSQGNEAAGVLDQILGRCNSGPCEPCGDIGQETQVIDVEGDAAEKLNSAVSDLVNAILGITAGEGAAPTEKDTEPEPEKSDKPKSKKGKKKDSAEKDEEDDDDDDNDDDKDDDE